LANLLQIPPQKLPSPPEQPRRASVAIIIRIRPLNTYVGPRIPIVTLDDFFSQPWTSQGELEILYMKRALREGDRWSGQVAFPGGKQDLEDKDDLDTAERETFEEGRVY
jgi:8-oxo-dGTP pyrophosphatase MutT (NUDIX family)